MQYYIMSIGYQLERKGDDDGLYTSLFAVLYGLAAALAPPAGMIADRFGVGVGQGVATSTLAISFLILLSPSLPRAGGRDGVLQRGEALRVRDVL